MQDLKDILTRLTDLYKKSSAAKGTWEYDREDGQIEHTEGGTVAWIQDHGCVHTVHRTGEQRKNADGFLIVELVNVFPHLRDMYEKLQCALDTANSIIAQEAELAKTLQEQIDALSDTNNALRDMLAPDMILGLRAYWRDNLLAFLNAFPEANTGDWYGELINVLTLDGNEPGSPNVTAQEIRSYVTDKK